MTTLTATTKADLPKTTSAYRARRLEGGTYDVRQILDLQLRRLVWDEGNRQQVEASLHRPDYVHAGVYDDTQWVHGWKYDKRGAKTESTIFMTLDQMRSLRDELNAMDL